MKTSLACSALCTTLIVGPASANLNETYQQGVAAFEARHYTDALDAFLTLLRRDPSDAQAHRYVDAIARAMAADQRSTVDRERLTMLQDLNIDAEAPARDDWRNGRLEEARLQMQQGHWLSASDLTLATLKETPQSDEARRCLSELQSGIQQTLAHPSDISSEERYALEGFYAYSQADYAVAVTAWQKARELGRQSVPGKAETAERLHFAPYFNEAAAHVEHEQRQAAQRALFDRGQKLYAEKHYAESLQVLRELALQNPDYPALARVLVQAELAAEQQRSKHLSEQRRREVARLQERANEYLQKDQLNEAEAMLTQALQLDPTNPQLQSHLALARDERSRRLDPKGAETHYQNGMNDAAAGRMEDALREFQLTLRMNPRHDRAIVAMGKIRRQLAYEREAP